MSARTFSVPRTAVVAVTALVVLTPVLLIFWQSFLSAPFFNPARHLSFGAYAFIFDDPDFWNAVLNSVVIATGMVADRAAARRRARVPAHAHRPPGTARHRSAGADPGVRVADGAGVRLRRVDGSGRLLFVVGEGPGRRRALERLFACEHRSDRRAHARSARLPLLVGGVEEPGVRRRGSGARRRREPAARRAERQPADDDAGAPVCDGAGVLPRLRDLRAAARAGRPRRPPRARDLPVQAHQQARHAVVPPDGGGRGVHHRDHVPAGVAAALAAQDRRQIRFGQGQGHAPEAAAARRLEVGRAGARRALARVHDRRADLRDRAARVRRAVGRGHQARRRADARQFPPGVRPVRPGARDHQHVPDRHARRRARGRVLHGDRPRRSPAARRRGQSARLPRADPPRHSGTARRPRVPVDLPVRAGA